MSRPAAAAFLLAAILVATPAAAQTSVPVPPRAAPVAGVEAAKTWQQLVVELTAVETMSYEDATKVAYPKFDAWMRTGSPKRLAALRLAVESFGFNAGVLSSYVVEALGTPEAEGTTESELRDVARAVSANPNLSMTVAVALGGTPGSLSTPGGAAFLEALLDPKFPQDRDPVLCYVRDVLAPVMPAWGTDERFDGRVVRLMAACPTMDTGAVLQGLADARPHVRLQALEGWEDARRQQRPGGQANEATVDAMVRLLTEGGLPAGETGVSGRPPMDIVAAALVASGREDEVMAELGNSGRMDDYEALSRAVKGARAPKGAYSLKDMLN